jgi:hypothetical protein
VGLGIGRISLVRHGVALGLNVRRRVCAEWIAVQPATTKEGRSASGVKDSSSLPSPRPHLAMDYAAYTESVIAAIGDGASPRVKAAFPVLIRHLHQAVSPSLSLPVHHE